MIEITNLSKNYGSKEAIKNINFNINGEIFGLLGPNGAGKSTLIKVLTDLLKPDTGKISIRGMGILQNPLKVKQCLDLLWKNLSCITG
ncbi:MAG: ATP-binding cassette domain-containing protein [Deltaproteobacteria bacterium]|nr:ATP-binding cassette domain-containing protein [Deltaproteobacteria bacterium]